MEDEQVLDLVRKLEKQTYDAVALFSPYARTVVGYKGLGVYGAALAVTLDARGAPLEDVARMQLAVQAELVRTVPAGVKWTLCTVST
jgi:hypothetical protein